MKRLLAFATLFALAGCGGSAPPQAPAASDQPATTTPPVAAAQSRLDAAIAGEWRSAENRARDAHRHPKETLEFFGVTDGKTVVEITPGGGWYAEILAPMLKDNGNYVAAIPLDSSSDYAKRSNERLREKFAAAPAQFGAAKFAEFDPKAPDLGMEGAADVVVTFRNVHNWIGNDSAEGMFKAFFNVLKPGGVLGVVEHRAADGKDLESVKDSGYLPTDHVIKLATDAGFNLVEQSEINANPKDTKDHEKGVWTLPPSLALKDVDRDKYLAIGESDRMTLRFVKPAGDQIFRQSNDSGIAGEKK
ncbi:MAG TPA: methyltransferase [Dokdonella sp.]|uniref:class I SAM-dependent methyltransferase n=1 Tax=Dokdonella sp. TaxID=2291710 RepID=UPI0025C6B70B|nr:methyltransferase [Dokdonella sp.]MBX3691364.1 methyltransferase [Dokdonella sp.]MCW5567731.1 methyltransferase [Dokdonella sp.]HNR90976.1 methyltransferase [Dokdonella sp.]